MVINECVSAIETTDEDYFDKALILKVRKFGVEPIEDLKLKQKALRSLRRINLRNINRFSNACQK